MDYDNLTILLDESYKSLLGELITYQKSLGTSDENGAYLQFVFVFDAYYRSNNSIISYIPKPENSDTIEATEGMFSDIEPEDKNLFRVALSNNMPKIVELFLEKKPDYANIVPGTELESLYTAVANKINDAEYDDMLILLLKYDVDVERDDSDYCPIMEYIHYFIDQGNSDHSNNIEIMIMMLNKLGFNLDQNCHKDVLCKAIASYMVRYHLSEYGQPIEILTQNEFEDYGSNLFYDSVYETAREMLDDNYFDDILEDINENLKGIIKKEFQNIQVRVPLFFFKVDSFKNELKERINNCSSQANVSYETIPDFSENVDSMDLDDIQPIYDNDKCNIEWLDEDNDRLCAEDITGMVQKVVRELLRESLRNIESLENSMEIDSVPPAPSPATGHNPTQPLFFGNQGRENQ